MVSSSLRESLEGLETVTDVAKCRGRVVSKMNLTFGVYMRPANCAPWERARQTRRRELGATPRICLISGVQTRAHPGFYIHYDDGDRLPYADARIYRLRNRERRNHRKIAPACIPPNFIGVLYQCEFDSSTCKNYVSLYEPKTSNYCWQTASFKFQIK